jgi:hypothetical protein
MKRVEQLVVLGGTLFFDVTETGISHPLVRHVDALSSGSRDFH